MTREAPGAGTCCQARYRQAAAALLPAGASLLFGAAGHTAAGGGVPGAGVTAAALVALTALNTVVAARARRHAFRAAVLGAAAQQSLLHLAFQASAGQSAHHPPGDGPMPHPAPAPLHAHEPVAADALTAMGAAHALATLGAVVVLLRGERLLRRLAQLLARRLRLAAPAGAACPETVRVPAPSGPPPLSFGARLASARGRRGPPMVIPAARTARARPEHTRPGPVRTGCRPVHLSQRAVPRRAGRGITHDHDRNRPGRDAGPGGRTRRGPPAPFPPGLTRAAPAPALLRRRVRRAVPVRRRADGPALRLHSPVRPAPPR